MSSPDVIPSRISRTNILSPSEADLSLSAFLKHKFWEPICTAARFIHLMLLFTPVIILSPIVFIGLPEKRFNGDRWGTIWWYNLLVSTMQRAGPTFIKLAQWAASRVDLFPSSLCERFGSLHSRGKYHSVAYTKRVIEKIFRLPFDDVFEEFDPTPIGTGAIAQVYRATLKKDLLPPSYLGPRRKRPPIALLQETLPSVPTASVALKILHPNVSKTIKRDLSIMSFFARAISVLPGMQWLSLPEEVEVFGRMMSQQCDLRHEAENLLTFEDNFSARKVPVAFPRPLTAWSTQECLVEEYISALPLEWVLRNGGGGFELDLAEVGLDAFLNMLLLDNFVHADLHPGNIMVRFSKPASTWSILSDLFYTLRSSSSEKLSSLHPDLSESDSIVSRLREVQHDRKAWNSSLSQLKGYIPELIFLDAGLVTTLSETNRKNFLDLFRSVASFDGYRAGELMISRSRHSEYAVDKETFCLKMQHLILKVKRSTFSLGEIKISEILGDVLSMVRKHHVKMEAEFVNTVISILLLEGIGRRLDPSLDLFKSSLPILRKVGGQMAAEGVRERDLPSGSDLAPFIKVWVWLEAREFINASMTNADDLIKYDWLFPDI